ncbi:hypothetical protein Y032_0020g160 [Ancylostoma ceylanicum]|uniref:Uncharacterized protein n=1 Tax=Ancylostoma ceylanicum TaxID=53326 RepID=A0A016V151_9BILA|nr:hypothetical protein Y032_0020g160 [Ancylostoma ceylanicum]
MFCGLNDSPSSSTQVAPPKASAFSRYNRLNTGSGDPQLYAHTQKTSSLLFGYRFLLRKCCTPKEGSLLRAVFVAVLTALETRYAQNPLAVPSRVEDPGAEDALQTWIRRHYTWALTVLHRDLVVELQRDR